MGYIIERDESVRHAVRRIGLEEADDAVGRLEDPGSDPDAIAEAVHEVRKDCKKLRGLARLVRPAIGDRYAQINAAARDAAAELSSIRDAQALLGTFDELLAATADQVPAGGLVDVRAALQERADRAGEAVDAGAAHMERARALLKAVRARFDAIDLSDGGWDALAGGLSKTYRRGRKAMRKAAAAPSPAAFHEWRKRAKYTWYHVTLLEDTAPTITTPMADSFHDLADALGDDHDLAVLRGQLRDAPEEFGGEEEVEAAVRLVDGVAADLQRRAFSLGSRLYAESASAFAERMGAYWDAWREDGDELHAGEIAEIYPHADDLDELSDQQLRERVRQLDFVGGPDMGREMMLAIVRASGGR